MGPQSWTGGAMGQVLAFGHCKSASTVSTTPDSTPSSTEGVNEDSDFPDPGTPQEFSEEDEETDSLLDWRMTAMWTEPGAGSRRDLSGALVRTETIETLLAEDDGCSSLMETQCVAGAPGIREVPSAQEWRQEAGGHPQPQATCEPHPPASDSAPHSFETSQSASRDTLTCETTTGRAAKTRQVGKDKSEAPLGERHGLETEAAGADSLQAESVCGEKSDAQTEAVSRGRQDPQREGASEDRSGRRAESPSEERGGEQAERVSGSRRSVGTECVAGERQSVQTEPVLEGRESPQSEPVSDEGLQPGGDPATSRSQEPGLWGYPECQLMATPITSRTQELDVRQRDVPETQRLQRVHLLRSFVAIPQSVTDLLYWEDVKKTGSVFGAIILVMFSLTQFSSISVLAYLTLSILSVTISLRVYTSVLHLVYKTQERHPFQVYLDMDITLSQEQLRKYTETLLLYITSSINHLRRLFLVQHLLESLKFGVLLWLMTYIGAVFNGLTIVILVVVTAFIVPLVYQKHKVQIDQYLGLLTGQINRIKAKIQAKFPSTKAAAQ
ncbi:reticulon-1 isoform X2 [Callorhinchus milii]|uniref:reticulon-1 isoform X2 n=1 Tax=Callorhinchus milii TaxID=7868 RepID=UPI001C3F6C2F|nr:reticulon-1 isoform X2 [Callorhinchus milii]